MDYVTKRKSQSCPPVAISIEEIRDLFASVITSSTSVTSLSQRSDDLSNSSRAEASSYDVILQLLQFSQLHSSTSSSVN